jgi:predicted enzyme related to lactoylglutathione lyase
MQDERGGSMGAKVVHFEVTTNGNAEELQKFYADTFGWNLDTNNPQKYGVITPDDAGIGGGVGGTPDPNMPGHVTFYVLVPDPEATLKEIESRGGKTVLPPSEVAPDTVIAMFQDPHGNLIGLSKG